MIFPALPLSFLTKIGHNFFYFFYFVFVVLFCFFLPPTIGWTTFRFSASTIFASFYPSNMQRCAWIEGPSSSTCQSCFLFFLGFFVFFTLSSSLMAIVFVCFRECVPVCHKHRIPGPSLKKKIHKTLVVAIYYSFGRHRCCPVPTICILTSKGRANGRIIYLFYTYIYSTVHIV